METMQSVLVKLSKVHANNGQIEGLPKNPRIIRDTKFDKLKQSIVDNPEMLALRELLLYPHDGKYIIIGGNMRFQAMKALGYKEAPAKILPENTPVEALRAYTIKDNAAFGEWNWDDLSNEWGEEELNAFGLDVWNSSSDVMDTNELDQFFEEAKGGTAQPNGVLITIHIPQEEADLEKDVRQLLIDALKTYPNVSVR